MMFSGTATYINQSILLLVIVSLVAVSVQAGTTPTTYPVTYDDTPIRDCAVSTGVDLSRVNDDGAMIFTDDRFPNVKFYFSICRPILYCPAPYTKDCYLLPNCTNSILCAEVNSLTSADNWYISLFDYDDLTNFLQRPYLNQLAVSTVPNKKIDMVAPNPLLCNGTFSISLAFQARYGSATDTFLANNCYISLRITSPVIKDINSPQSTSDNLSPGAITAIALAVIFGILFILAMVGHIYVYRRHSKFGNRSANVGRTYEYDISSMKGEISMS